MILDDTVELANAMLKVGGLNQKSALGLLSQDRSTGVLIQSTGFNSLPRLISSRKSDKSNILSGNEGIFTYPNQACRSYI